MQLSGIIGLPILLKTGWYEQYTSSTKLHIVSGHWAIISFLIALLIILLLLKKDTDGFERHRARIGATVGWMIAGIFLAFLAQTIAGNIEVRLFGIEQGSENTERLIQIVAATPWFIIVTSLFGPILEEIVFRKIVFGTLYKQYNFFISAIISSLLFAAVHFDFSHLLIYTSMGMVFAFLYVQTRRILVPIVAHVIMNTIVILINVIFHEELQRIMEKAEKLQAIIGGF
jgi:membrane protease YdiL (CAAX protease family)